MSAEPAAPPSPRADFAEPARSPWRDGAIILAVCGLVYWLFLGATPLAASEGHRVAPGWAMLETGEWSRTEMFGLNYVRKPPGMPWAIAASSWLLGQNEFAARAPSALACTLMAFVAFGFGRAWFGPRAGLAAGLAQALLPLMWTGGGGGAGGPGRSAEIEALNTFCTQAAVLPLIAMLLRAQKGASGAAMLALVSALGIVGCALTKSAASAPCIAGALIGVCIARRSGRPLLHPAPWLAISVGAAAAYFALRHFAGINDDADAVRETGEFLWREPRKVISVVPMAVLAAAPMSLFLLVPFKAALTDSSDESGWTRCVVAARACAAAWIASCLLYAAIGVGNPRYLMPASVFIAPVIGFVVRGLAGGGSGPFARAGFEEPLRTFLKRIIIRGPGAWAAALLGAAIVINSAVALRRPPVTGEAVGNTLAGNLPAGATVWADDAIEARPDVLLYARRAAERAGRGVAIVWAKPRMHAGKLPAHPGAYMLLRTDPESGEGVRYLAPLEAGRLRMVTTQTLGKYELVLFRVEPPAR